MIDSGAASLPEEGTASSTFGHNGVIIDGKGQLPCGHGWGCSGEIIGVRLEPSATFFSGDAARAYAAQDYNPVIRANRQCFLVKDEPHYAVILDDYVKDSQEHDFSLLLHTVLLEDPVIDAGAGLVNGILEFAGRRVRLTIQVLHPAITSIDFDISENSNNLPFPEHARWSFTRKAREAIFIAVIYVEELDKPSWFEHMAAASVSKHDDFQASVFEDIRDGPAWPNAPRHGRLTPGESPARYTKHKGYQQQTSRDGGAASSLSQLCGDPAEAIRITLFHSTLQARLAPVSRFVSSASRPSSSGDARSPRSTSDRAATYRCPPRGARQARLRHADGIAHFP